MRICLNKYPFLTAQLVIVFGALCLPGCGVLQEYQVSVPEAVPPGFAGKISRATLELQLPDLKIAVEMKNYRTTGNILTFVPLLPLSVPVWFEPEDVSPALFIWLAVTPMDGQETFTFDASRIIIKSEDGELVEPTDFIGPCSKIWQSSRGVAGGCGQDYYRWENAISYRIDFAPEDVRTPQIPVSFRGPNCFVLRFDMAAPAEQMYTLSIEGVRHAGRPIQLPEIRYRRGLIFEFLALP